MVARIGRIVCLILLSVMVLAGIETAAAQDTFPTATPDPATDATALFNGPITDPRVDPTGTLDDAFFYSIDHDSIVPAKDGDTTLQPGEFQLLPADVAVTDFYAEFYFLTPQIPDGGEFSAGFCFWTDADGSCYDVHVQTDNAGNSTIGLGYAPAVGDYVMLVQTNVLADQPIDPTPGAENSIDIVVYDGYVIIEGNTFEPLAVLALPDSALAGKVKAQIGFVDYGLPAGTAPMAVSLSDFAVWDLAGADGSAEPLPSTPGSDFGAPVAQPTVAAQPAVPTQTAQPTVQAAISPVVPQTQGDPILTAVFEGTRAHALALPPLVGGLSGDLVQSSSTFAWTAGNVSVADFYAIATFVNPADLSAPSDIGIGFRAVSDTDLGMRVIVQSTGAWYLLSPADATLASGIASSFDATPGASNTIEILAQGGTGVIALNGVILQQVDLSAVTAPGDIFVGAGFLTGDGVDGRVTPFDEFWVYPMSTLDAVSG